MTKYLFWFLIISGFIASILALILNHWN